MINVRRIKAEETYPIRREVLRKNIDLPYRFEEDFDKDTFHLGAYIDNELVGIVTLIKKKSDVVIGDYFQLRGMGTLLKYRGKGVGKLLVLRLEEYLRNNNIHKIWCNARVEAAGFYKSLNYSILGKSFDVPKIGKHYLMIKEF